MTGKTLDLPNEVTAPNHHDAHTNIEQATLYKLANDADCASPDSSDSPGAGFLNRVRTMVLESWAEAMPSDERGDVSELLYVDWADTAHTIADGAPSVYTYELWTQFVDLAAWQELDEVVSDGLLEVSSDSTNDNDMGPTFTIPAVCLYSIARRLALVLLESLVDALQLDVDNLDEADDVAVVADVAAVAPANTVTIKFRAKLDDFAGGKGYKVPVLTHSHVSVAKRDMLGITFMSSLANQDVTRARLAKFADLTLPGVVFAADPGAWTVTPIGKGFMADISITAPLV